jgi:hypothetical protein
MSDAQYHLREIQDGYQIFEERLEVAGVQYRRDEAQKFAEGKGLYLEFERDLSNQHDPNAIKIIGCRRGFFGTKKHFIGFVPSEVASSIVEGGYYERVLPRLLKTYVGDSGFVEILFQVLGPKGARLSYKRVDPVSLPIEKLGNDAHYSDYTDQVRLLKQEKRYDEAVKLLERLVEETERESKRDKCGVAPWYYEQLAIIYSKLKRPNDEIAILERYEAQKKAPGAGPAKLAERLEKLRKKRSAN